jgi:hypothetical protein
MVFLNAMGSAIASDEIADIQTQAHEISRRQLNEWFVWMDRILDIHRSNCIFREPTAEELEQHKTMFKAAIRTSNLINALIADPDFNDSEMTARLHVRIRQLQDAYDTFHDPTLSDAQAGEFLKQVFPE